MSYEFLEDFGRKRPGYDVNLARMRNDAHPDKVTLFVEGEDDRNFFRSFLKDRSRWKIEYGPGKKGVLDRFRKYRENPTVHYAVFSADLDFDFAVELLLKKDDGFGSRIVQDERFFYQLFDVTDGKGFNDLETFLFLSDSYSSMMVEYYDDDDVIDGIRGGIVEIGMVMGAFRVANILVRELNGLPEGTSMLNYADPALGGNIKFGTEFLDSFGLVDFAELKIADLEMVGDNLKLAFAGNAYSRFLPQVLRKVHEILAFLEAHPRYRANFLRGHDLMDLLARKMAFDRGRKGSSFKTKKKLVNDGDAVDLEKLRDELESDLRKAAGNSMDEIKKFPLGNLLR